MKKQINTHYNYEFLSDAWGTTTKQNRNWFEWELKWECITSSWSNLQHRVTKLQTSDNHRGKFCKNGGN